MASPFDVFDRPTYTLKRSTSPTSGHFNSSDIWQAPQVTTPAPTIQGHLYTVERQARETDWRPSSEGFIEAGSLRFATETLLQVGDIIEAAQEGGITYRYRVMALARPMRLIASLMGTPTRYEFILNEVPR